MKFKLLVGRHVEGNRKDGTQRVYRARTKDNIVESDIDLCAKFNQFGAIKFERIPDVEQYVAPVAPVVQVTSVKVAAPTVDTVETLSTSSDRTPLERMTVSELRKMADELDIDIGEARTKADIIEVIEAAQDS